MGDLTFTLGLSGWTANDWSRMGNFDLMAPRGEVDTDTAERVINGLTEAWQISAEALAKKLALDETLVKSALSLYAQQGRVLYDTEAKVYRLRELIGEPLPMDQLRFSHPREAKADNFVRANLVTLNDIEQQDKKITVIKGAVMDNAQQHLATIFIDQDERLFDAHCSCDHYRHNKLYKGPCEHMLAIRKVFAEQKRGRLS